LGSQQLFGCPGEAPLGSDSQEYLKRMQLHIATLAAPGVPWPRSQ
jgi:hypothetical protein